ncbi:MAG: hypothetical protein QOF02_2591 [Blastocatellia bacterium]|jgi:HEAT repeat protein|nr:hypothetical protein [Blastocatellia bacterium]
MIPASLKHLSLSHARSPARCAAVALVLLCAGHYFTATAQLPPQRRCLPPSAGAASLQQQLEIQSRRLSSTDVEERRCAVMSLGWLNRADSARAAAVALRDAAAIVRATAARAVLALSSDEAAASLLPLLNDRDEFVRQETAYALGETRSRQATARLLSILETEKLDSVRGASVVALGLISDETAVVPLAEILNLRMSAPGLINKVRRKKRNENEFVRRAAARSLGQIKSRAAVPALIAALSDTRAPDDVRREAALALGIIGDPSAIAPLRAALSARDPYLSRIAHEALLKIAYQQQSKI